MTDPGKPTIILLAEDEVLVRMFVWDTLTEDGGWNVLEASNADEALAVLYARSDIRLLITDVRMPGTLDGLALARLVAERSPEISIIVMSAFLGDRQSELPVGATLLPKPFTTAALLNAVREKLKVLQPISFPEALPSPRANAVLPAGLKLDQPHASLGITGGLAQPLPETPDE